ncbi:MAG: M20 family metallo-hydrolase [Bacteroidales bacterium]|jgi:acetylornithine deacetylase|nr:M20 family metallo-hydrolase [Bacteroidales bacterium]
MNLYEDSIQLLRHLVRIPSLSGQEAEVVACVRRFLSDCGIPSEEVRGNVLALNRRFDPAKPTLALDAHLDTVPANNGYTRDPHDPGNDPDILYGLGSNDDGGSVVSMTAAFRHFFEADMPVNLMLILSRQEEVSGPDGARWLFAPDGLFASGGRFPMPRWVIVGEPTGMRAATSERGLLVIDGQAQGVSGHAARGEGVNALYIALDDIAALRAHRFARISPLMGEVKLNVTQIEAGQAHNVIPDRCRFVVDIRPTEQYSNEEIVDELQALCRSRLTARNLLNRSSATREGSPLLRAVRTLGIEAYSSPTTSDWMRIPCDAVKMGPGESIRSHKADEFILAREIREGIDKYIAFIETFYGNTLE